MMVEMSVCCAQLQLVVGVFTAPSPPEKCIFDVAQCSKEMRLNPSPQKSHPILIHRAFSWLMLMMMCSRIAARSGCGLDKDAIVD